ncbi:DUF1405 domain-containing protein [Haloarcula litorea]|uniref:DUF1405 domain-containing protein n=1 Tax=Haloarcula litorea TaxID=3032579 RepID=UPI0023E7C236|nr:DUF1405 domain-containing protein [Halomicroarcula sp. GDY20]
MATEEGVGGRIEAIVARRFDGPVPEDPGLPWYVAPLPTWLENVALRLAWPIAVINLLGTLFGFWYYAGRPLDLAPPLVEGQLGAAPPLAYPLIPDSPVATLFIGLSFAAWRLDWDVQWLHALAFFGCIKLGLWTPYVQLVVNGVGNLPLWLYWFLILSHLAMAVEAFVIHRYAAFSIPAVAVATGWYLFNDVVDYFVPVLDGPHHTFLRAEPLVGAYQFDHTVPAHDLAAAWAVVLTVLAVFLALATRVERLRTT